MKVPQIHPRSGLPPIFLKEVDLHQYPNLAETVLGRSFLNSETAEVEEHLRFWFANCVGLKPIDVSKAEEEKGWHFSFQLTKVHKAASSGVEDFSMPNILLSLLLSAFLPASVTVKGRLVEASSGRTLAEKKLSNTITPKHYRSSDGPPALPLVEHAVLRLLDDLEKKAIRARGLA
ncbi:hypothetical protein ABVF61_23720 [Roseibium sp. HPY-6]|uniref:hypothetical protein n=1 Tax=Roseibium sp. HPY-6 TaxID=3229852 RepID=UPI00338FCC8B